MHAIAKRIQQKRRQHNHSSVAGYLTDEERGGHSIISEGAMNHFSSEKLEEIRQQMSLHRTNLLCVCRLAIGSLLEKAHYEGVDDSCNEFKNLATILEHILSHRLKGQISWFGLEEQREFWDFISAICISLPHNCIDSITNMEDAKSPKAKGRAWIRSALMEKRLAEYIHHTLKDDRALKAFFGEGAFMRSEEAHLVARELEKLSTIDFSSCLKGNKLETGVANVIDYTRYLQILLRDTGLDGATSALSEHNGMEALVSESQSLNITSGASESKYIRLQEQYRGVCEQKDYLEGLVQDKDHQLANYQTECKHLQQALKHTDLMARQEHQQLQKTIIQLQNKVTDLVEARQMARHDLEEHLIAGQWSPQAADIESIKVLQQQPESISLDNLFINLPSEMPSSPDRESDQSLDPSIDSPISGTSNASLYVPSDSEKSITTMAGQRSQPKDKEETQSLIALAGSFTSQMSVRSTETTSSASGMLDSDTHAPYLYRIRPMSPDSTSSDSVSCDVTHPLVVS